MRRSLAAAAFLLSCSGCGLLSYSTPRKVPRTSYSGHVGKVPVTVVARLIAGTELGAPSSSGHPGIDRKPPFLIAITPLLAPDRDGHWPPVVCDWNARGPNPRRADDDPGFALFLSGDDRKIEELWSFDAALQPSLTRLADHLVRYPSHAWVDAFYVAPLCAQGDRAALVLHYGNPRMLWGQGFLVLLRRSGDGWTVEAIDEQWIS